MYTSVFGFGDYELADWRITDLFIYLQSIVYYLLSTVEWTVLTKIIKVKGILLVHSFLEYTYLFLQVIHQAGKL